MVTLEESQPNSYPAMHDSPQDDVVIVGALPASGEASLGCTSMSPLLSR